MSPLPLQFPVISIAPRVRHDGVRGGEDVRFFHSARGFGVCEAWQLKFHSRDGMFLADSTGRCWRIVQVHNLGLTGWGWVFLFLGQPVYKVSCELEEVQALSLDDLKERICVAIQSNPDYWRDDEAIAGCCGPPRDEQEMLQELQDKVRQARSVPQIINALYDEHYDEHVPDGPTTPLA